MKLYKTDEYGELYESVSDKGYYGEDVYNPREWLPTLPPVEKGKVARVEDGKWVVYQDARGTYYNTLTGQEIIITKPFESTEGLTTKKPCEYPKWDGAGWIVDKDLKTLTEEQAKIQAEELLIQAEIRKIAISNLGSVLKTVKK